MKTENRVKVWRMTDLHDAELLKGIYARHTYPWHSHEELSFGLVIGGAIRLRTRLRDRVAKAGSFVLINSDEIHQGFPAVAEGWQCRTLHLLPDAVRAIAADITNHRGSELPRFEGPTFEDASLSQAFLDLHRLAEVAASSLDRQTRVVKVIARLLNHHSSAAPPEQTLGDEPKAVTVGKAFLDEHLGDKVTLDELAAEAGLPPFRFLRAFQRAVGITPHTYQLQARIRRAHEFLKRGESIADVSLMVGFSDQAHLTRVYRSIMGGTPGQFRAAAMAA